MRAYFRWAAAAADAGAVPASQGSDTPLARLICISVVGPATPSGVRPCGLLERGHAGAQRGVEGVVGRRRRGALLRGKLRAHGVDQRAARAHRQRHRIAGRHAPERGEVAAPGGGQQRQRHLQRRLAHHQRGLVVAQARRARRRPGDPARRAARARSGARAGAAARGRRGRGSSARPARRRARTGRRRPAAAPTRGASARSASCSSCGARASSASRSSADARVAPTRRPTPRWPQRPEARPPPWTRPARTAAPAVLGLDLDVREVDGNTKLSVGLSMGWVGEHRQLPLRPQRLRRGRYASQEIEPDPLRDLIPRADARIERLAKEGQNYPDHGAKHQAEECIFLRIRAHQRGCRCVPGDAGTRAGGNQLLLIPGALPDEPRDLLAQPGGHLSVGLRDVDLMPETVDLVRGVGDLGLERFGVYRLAV